MIELESQALKPHNDIFLAAERERIMTDHLPVVRFIAQRIHKRLPRHVKIEDLYSAGLVGLLDALEKFVPAKHVQFRSYAQFRIRGAIIDSLRDLDWGSRALRRKGRGIEHAIQTLTRQLGRAPTELEIAHELDISLPVLQKMLCELKGLEVSWLDSTELAVIPGRREDDPLFRFLNVELRARLIDAIGHLAEQERRVLTLYYYESLKQREIGTILGVTESRVSQILTSAILRLRAELATVMPSS
jgi:RNA polymerase sigma factor FliA